MARKSQAKRPARPKDTSGCATGRSYLEGETMEEEEDDDDEEAVASPESACDAFDERTEGSHRTCYSVVCRYIRAFAADFLSFLHLFVSVHFPFSLSSIVFSHIQIVCRRVFAPLLFFLLPSSPATSASLRGRATLQQTRPRQPKEEAASPRRRRG